MSNFAKGVRKPTCFCLMNNNLNYITMEILERYTMAYTEFGLLEVNKAYAHKGLPNTNLKLQTGTHVTI